MQRAFTPQNRSGWPAALTANSLVLGVVVFAWALQHWSPDLYYRALQEDQALEWSTFWAFLLATVGFCVGARRQYGQTARLPWFSAGLALFCFFVAMEEISWGQRIFGYQPPEYFLAQNFQQELNLHNVLDTGIRKLTLKSVILGYGVLLPLTTLIPGCRRWWRRIGIQAPPLSLAPAFAGAYLLYEIYPWSHSGELVELMLGLGFLFAAQASLGSDPLLETGQRQPTAIGLVGAAVASLALGTATAALTNTLRDSDPKLLEAARMETAALAADFSSGRVESDCSLHKRLYTFMKKYEQQALRAGEFADLVSQGLPETRAEFFLDPWNSPYWILDACRQGRRVTFIYSFGPDRSRDSTRQQILGDDIGAYIRQ